MTVNAITDTKKGRTGIAPTYLHTTRNLLRMKQRKQRTQEAITKVWLSLVHVVDAVLHYTLGFASEEDSRILRLGCRAISERTERGICKNSEISRHRHS